MSQVRRNDEAMRYEVVIDDELAGRLTFLRHRGAIVLDHTVVPDEFAGQGIAGSLVRAALDDLRERGIKAVPLCPYVSGWLQRHPDYQDVVDQELLAQIEAGA